MGVRCTAAARCVAPQALRRPDAFPAPLFALTAVDATLLTILVLLALATGLAILRARRRDRCLRAFDDFHVTLSELDGDLVWGRAHIYATGLEIEYPKPIVARGGHLERSFLFYKDQFDTMTALYRCPEGLSPDEQDRRAATIEQTANPGLLLRALRWLRNWMSMVRDALVQAVGLLIGVAKTRAPGSAVFTSQEQNMKALSGEIIGHTGNAFDPLLEQHLFTQVVVEVTVDGTTRSYCGWLKDYTSAFIEVLDAYANTSDAAPRPVRPHAPGCTDNPNIDVAVHEGRLHVTNQRERMLYIQQITAGDWAHPVDAVMPPCAQVDVTLPPGTDPAEARAWVGTADRVDMVVPRHHALVRHAAGGSDETYLAYRKRIAGTSRPASETPPADEAAAPESAALSSASTPA